MDRDADSSLFILGEDYHLGDLLWFTAVLADFREKRPGRVMVGCPDRPISRILERNPLIDALYYGRPGTIIAACRRLWPGLSVWDLRVIPIGLRMVGQWRQRVPWLYYRDLWLEPRGQWLATYLGLGKLGQYRPSLRLADDDRRAARTLPERYVVLAPHIGQYKLPLTSALWRQIKGWNGWQELTMCLRATGYHAVTLAARNQEPVAGTLPLLGLPIRQAAGVIEGASGLISGESGLWFIAAALRVPFIIVPWWLPRSVDWVAPMAVPHALIRREQASVEDVLTAFERVNRCSYAG